MRHLTSTYIKSPNRNEEPVFTVCGSHKSVSIVQEWILGEVKSFKKIRFSLVLSRDGKRDLPASRLANLMKIFVKSWKATAKYLKFKTLNKLVIKKNKIFVSIFNNLNEFQKGKNRCASVSLALKRFF